jgi:phosphoserine phosphatase
MNALKYPLVCFDLDGTLVDDTIFIWNTLHETFATDLALREKARDDYFQGRIGYSDWFHHDLKLLDQAGANQKQIYAVLDGLKPMPGALELIALLKQRGHRLGIISGSLDIVVSHLFGEEIFDHVLINRIWFDLSGRIAGGEPTPYDLHAKADGLKDIARREGIPLSATAFVGDNYNDIAIAQTAGLSIAFNCKSDELRRACDVEIKEKDLTKLINLIS